ncbi:hypothetical protein [Micromonospora chokoriensis]|uniref:Uncharacterized protein n=1 Tax=Micromonospora chokoriensis TaxID=356851 RepID=A0A1C4ZDM5_9ACTN|nr:hypothetical protein [Micromonospora chokoriensis]SCF30994.1 hypothetical protein GA0070612_6253 [Micromonospora chokoriensis]
MSSPEMVDYIRTMIRGDHAANDRVEARLDELGWEGFPTLLGAVFYFAVNRRFDERTTPGEIMRFVADMRASTPAGTPEIDANAAEQLISAAVNPNIATDIDPQMAGRVQGLVILRILGQGAISDEDLDALLAEATELASRV